MPGRWVPTRTMTTPALTSAAKTCGATSSIVARSQLANSGVPARKLTTSGAGTST